jgi:hypothetical protein
MAAALLFGKTKTPPPVWQWGSINLWDESEPDCRAAQQQRVVWQQIQIPIALHGRTVITRWIRVKFIFAPKPVAGFLTWEIRVANVRP